MWSNPPLVQGALQGAGIPNQAGMGGGLSTSTRLDYHWLNIDRSWMFGLNGGYDTC